MDGFTGMGIARVAITLSMFRKMIFLGGAFLIPATMGIKYIFYTEPVSDFISAYRIGGDLLVIDRIINRSRYLTAEHAVNRVRTGGTMQ